MAALFDYSAQLLEGAALTLELAFTSLCFGLLLGLAGAAAKMSALSWLRQSAHLVSNVLRGIPEFLILLICYFGLSNLINTYFAGTLSLSPFAGGVVALALVFGAYASEVFRGAFLAVPKGQLEAARSYGLSRWQIFWCVQLPQAWRICLPSLNNMWQNLLKDTSLVSIVGLEDMLRKANIAAQFTKQPFVFYAAVAVIYLLLLAVSNPAFAYFEKRANRGYASPA
ncbi:ABC transporter permease [Vogesella indigofera]|uniref:ABC transporter permease n=1 Tax=Vogesella indigofera TaxID=45465 RepID=UPI00234F6A6C|nr:ABC transporter permease subunit [Vogesella indigofera]MDC7699484.1 ABC transporter permease subunit [Vogesella indigofera]